MLLAIDAGNTNIVFAVFDGEQVRGEWRASTHTDRTADELGVWLMQLLTTENLKREDISAVIIASVVPAIVFNLKTLCRRYFGCEPRVVGDEGVELGIKVLLDRPEEVGADRLVNGGGAYPIRAADRHRYRTATTFDVVDQGYHCGGAIAPGHQPVAGSLMAAAKLPRGHRPGLAGDRQGHRAGDDAVVFWGYVGLIEAWSAAWRKSSRQDAGGRHGGLAPLSPKRR